MQPNDQQPYFYGGGYDVGTLRIGNLQDGMNENYLNWCFCQFPEFQSAKVIHNKQTGQSEGYGFLYISSRTAAENILQICNGMQMPDSEQIFNLSLAEEEDDSPDFTMFVGDLDAAVMDQILKDEFKSTYQTVKSATVVRDQVTGYSRCYRFVRFRDEREQERAIEDMYGVEILSRPIKTGPATNKRFQSAQTQRASNQNHPQRNPGGIGPNNATIYVRGLNSNVTTPEDLVRFFSQCGEVVYVTIKSGTTYGFVQFSHRSSAVRALRTLDGTQLGGRRIRVSWGRFIQNQQ